MLTCSDHKAAEAWIRWPASSDDVEEEIREFLMKKNPSPIKWATINGSSLRDSVFGVQTRSSVLHNANIDPFLSTSPKYSPPALPRLASYSSEDEEAIIPPKLLFKKEGKPIVHSPRKKFAVPLVKTYNLRPCSSSGKVLFKKKGYATRLFCGTFG
ncbi:hypothetical protein O181_127083 [Austropuccinia psidii MF-1]|uniref:Uncharacterized protein n=1 Tax=Austropuccinia psidii MF-1 TaxID=1389203 RepID=A0A9Q3KSI5_9BASI|nr:hypothetical protein [Austropuccinia psidii MF-1]